jgi:leucyl/phenylalanyl-tRNA---protein transferase
LFDRWGSGGTAVSVLPSRAPHPASKTALRAALFRETPFEVAQRVGLGTLRAFSPVRIRSLPVLVKLWVKDLLAGEAALPDPEAADNADGVVGFVNDLSPATLLQGARQGLYALGHVGRPKWCSPQQRAVLFPDEFHIPKSVRKLMRHGGYRTSFDQAFEQVVAACAGKRQGRWHVTWITPRVMQVYAALHDAGFAHSFEVWNRDGALVGGGYGVSVGGLFVGESLFSIEPDTAKIALAMLVWHLARWDYRLIDTKLLSPLTTSMGFRRIPRAAFLRALGQAVEADGHSGPWRVEAGLEAIADWQPVPEAPGRTDRMSKTDL